MNVRSSNIVKKKIYELRPPATESKYAGNKLRQDANKT